MWDFDEFIDLPKTLEKVNFWIKKIYLLSVDLTEIYQNKINYYQYWIAWMHLIMMFIGIVTFIAFISNDWLYTLIDNEFLPNKFKILCIYLILCATLAMMLRFDLLMAEGNRNLSVLKVFYYLQLNLRSKHGLNQENYRKYSILCKFLHVISFLSCFGFNAFGWLYYLYIAIRANRIFIHLITPFFFYILLLATTAVFACSALGIGMFYYYILMFKQINCQITLIHKQSKIFLNKRNQRQFICLMESHHSLELQIDKLNLMLRRSILFLYIFLGVGFIIPFNICISSNDKFEQFYCSGAILFFIVFGFSITYLLSTLIRVAHKPNKTAYKIFRKQNLICNFEKKFQLKWKVIDFEFKFLY